MSIFNEDQIYTSRELQRIYMDSNPNRHHEGKPNLPLAENAGTYFAWFINRIKCLQDAGLPIPNSWFQENIDLLGKLKILKDSSAKNEGMYYPSDVTVIMKRDLKLPLDVKNRSSGYILIHELWHFMSGVQFSIEDGNLQIDRTTGFVDGAYQSGQEMLAEATAEALTRWTISDMTPNFSTMTTEDFFAGPSDVPITVYIQHQKAVGKALKDMPLATLIRGNFADGKTINKQSQCNQDYVDFCETLDKTVDGGWQTLEKIANALEIPSIHLPKFVRENPFLAEVSRKIAEYRMSRAAGRALDRN